MSQANEIKLKLMVVDDEPDNLDLLYRTFRREFRVFKADSGFNALQVLEQEGEMAVIISDQRMPQMNGTEFLSKTVDQYPETIRILLTGYTDVEDLVEAINSGKVFKYITKPWNPENLKSVIQQASETYKVLKKRTNELRRILRRESLVNAVMTAIRESLDYSSMLQTIVKSIGVNFDASCCILRPVDSDRLMSDSFYYQAANTPTSCEELNPDGLIQAVLESRQTQIQQGQEQEHQYTHLIVPLICQQQLLGILYLYQHTNYSAWSSEDVQLIESVADQAALAISQAKLYQQTQQQAEQMRAELQVAHQIQTNLLRQSWPEIEGVKVQACCYPAREVGGDFFEVYVHPQGDVWVAVGDVSGKGVPAALFMASAISVLRRELGQETSPEPEIVMQGLNRSLSEDLSSTNCFITMVLARFTPTTKQLAYANAGHIYPIIWSQKLVAQQLATGNQEAIVPNYLKTRGIPLGILPTWKGTGGKVTIDSGDTLLLTSDGITEATITQSLTIGNSPSSNDPSIGSMLKQEGLWQLLLQQLPLDLNKLLTCIRSIAEVQEDDQTILSLEVL